MRPSTPSRSSPASASSSRWAWYSVITSAKVAPTAVSASSMPRTAVPKYEWASGSITPMRSADAAAALSRGATNVPAPRRRTINSSSTSAS